MNYTDIRLLGLAVLLLLEQKGKKANLDLSKASFYIEDGKFVLTCKPSRILKDGDKI